MEKSRSGINIPKLQDFFKWTVPDIFLLLFYANTAQSKIEENTVFSTEFLLIRIQESEINAELLDLDPHGIFDMFIKCA
jgi:hypothetical protein